MNTKIFQATWALQQLPVTMKLSSLEWRFLICCDGKAAIEQIQTRLGLADAERETILQRLCAGNLLSEKILSLEEFAAASVDSPAHRDPLAQQTLVEHLQAAEPSRLEAHEMEEQPEPEPSDPEPIKPRAPDRPAAVGDQAAPTFRPLPKPTATAPTVRSMSLQAAIQFILNQTSDPTAGHLATYQVFMGINTQLLKRNGITSLRFQDDRLITDPELQQAISENITKVLKVECPEDLFFQVSAPERRPAAEGERLGSNSRR